MPDNRSKRWMVEAGKKLGVPPDLIARAFSRDEDRTTAPDGPLEIPDVMAITYKYSYGGISRFFREVRDQARLLGSHCRRCAFIYLPPRVHCSQCYESTQWVPVGPEGTVRTCTTVHYATSTFFRKTPYVCAYIQVDGADTLLLHNVVTENPRDMRPGCRVRVHFREREERLGEIGDFFFIPANPSTEKNPGDLP